MNAPTESEQNTNTITAQEIAEYLRKHPGFFNDYPELLADIQVPHASGSAVSLVEKQVAILREKNERTHKQIHDLIEIARQNEELARRMHKLALILMDATDTGEIFSTLYENLRSNFNADRVIVRVFAEPAFIDTYAGEEFAGRDIQERSLFKSIIEKRIPISGRLKRQQQAFLFGEEGDDISSAVIVPLHGPDWGGVLVIGSTNPEKFQETMGVELLANLGEILSFIIKPWVAEK
ncbi:MAG: DUF484 family protein [Gammaproteobacteria bacterium]